MNESSNRIVLLYGTGPGGKSYVGNFKRPSVIKITGKADMQKYIVQQSDPSNKEKINSILIITTPGDNISLISDLHEFAVRSKILLTSIIIIKTFCDMTGYSDQLGSLRRKSDMVIFTTDQNYMEYMVECIT
jgi:hypothetical protein